MSYTPNVWQAGDVVTPAKLNHIEAGIASGSGSGGAMLLTVTKTTVGITSTYTLNKTWNEIKDALAEGTHVVLYGEGTGEYAQFTVARVWQAGGEYGIDNINVQSSNNYEYAILGTQNKTFEASSADGYPAVEINDK